MKSVFALLAAAAALVPFPAHAARRKIALREALQLAAKQGPLHVGDNYTWDRVVGILLHELLH